jgi:hypothetical protein
MKSFHIKFENPQSGIFVNILKYLTGIILLGTILMIIRIALLRSSDDVYSSFWSVSFISLLFWIARIYKTGRRIMIYELKLKNEILYFKAIGEFDGESTVLKIPIKELLVLRTLNGGTCVVFGNKRYILPSKISEFKEVTDFFSPLVKPEKYVFYDIKFAFKNNTNNIFYPFLILLFLILPPFDNIGFRIFIGIFILTLGYYFSQRKIVSKKGILTKQVYPPYSNISEIYFKKYMKIEYHEKDSIIHGPKVRSYLKCTNKLEEDIFMISLAKDDIDLIKLYAEKSKLTFKYFPAYTQ